MKNCTHLISSSTLGLALAVALVALGNVVVTESASAQARPPPAGSAARPAARPAQAQPNRAAPPATAQPRRQAIAPPQAVANNTRGQERNAQGLSARARPEPIRMEQASGRPVGIRMADPWNQAARSTTPTPAAQRTRQSGSGRTVAFREHRSTAASATTARPGPAPSVYRSAPTQSRAVANQTRTTQRMNSGRAAVGDGRRSAVSLGTASPVNTWSGWNRAVNTRAPAANTSRTRQSGGGGQVTFRESRASARN